MIKLPDHFVPLQKLPKRYEKNRLKHGSELVLFEPNSQKTVYRDARRKGEPIRFWRECLNVFHVYPARGQIAIHFVSMSLHSKWSMGSKCFFERMKGTWISNGRSRLDSSASEFRKRSLSKGLAINENEFSLPGFDAAFYYFSRETAALRCDPQSCVDIVWNRNWTVARINWK